MKISVTSHALQQARVRRHFPGHNDQALRNRIRSEVEQAIAAGRVKDHTPPEFQLYSRADLGDRPRKPKNLPLQAGKRFVFAEDGQHAWIVAREHAETVVITSLHRCRAQAAAA